MNDLKARRTAAAYHSTEPTLTDQAAAATTDLNIIVNQFLRTGHLANQKRPAYGDFSKLPQDLRGIIEQSRSVSKLRRDLPPELREMPMEQLLTLTTDQLTTILAPPKPADQPRPAEIKKEEK